MYDSHVSAGALPWTQLRELTALPDPLAGEEGPVFPKPHFHCRAFGLGPSGLSASPHPHFSEGGSIKRSWPSSVSPSLPCLVSGQMPPVNSPRSDAPFIE